MKNSGYKIGFDIQVAVKDNDWMNMAHPGTRFVYLQSGKLSYLVSDRVCEFPKNDVNSGLADTERRAICDYLSRLNLNNVLGLQARAIYSQKRMGITWEM